MHGLPRAWDKVMPKTFSTMLWFYIHVNLHTLSHGCMPYLWDCIPRLWEESLDRPFSVMWQDLSPVTCRKWAWHVTGERSCHMTEKGLSSDACLANNVGIRPLTFDHNPKDIKILEPGGKSPRLISCQCKNDRILSNKYTNDTVTQVHKENKKLKKIIKKQLARRQRRQFGQTQYNCAHAIRHGAGSTGILNSRPSTTVNGINVHTILCNSQ